VIERHSQFPTHNEIGLIGIYCPAFLQEIVASLCGVQENKTLSEHVDVDDLAYIQRVRRTQGKVKVAGNSPYVLDQSVTLSHSWWAVRLRMLPTSGSGFGPGGLGSPGARFLVK